MILQMKYGSFVLFSHCHNKVYIFWYLACTCHVTNSIIVTAPSDFGKTEQDRIVHPLHNFYL